jgi:NitT/TauT family transport system ATP-binding protein
VTSSTSSPAHPAGRSAHEGPPGPGAAAIALRGVGKTFDNDVTAVENVDLTVGPDEFVAIVGLSGCGKSTLLRVVAGLTPASSGAVDVLGAPVVAPRQDVGLMFQRPALLAWKTALENVLLPVAIRGRITDDDIREALRLFDLFGLAGFEQHFPRQLSGGMQQRVALARLLMTGARVLLLDEPFGALDELTREHLNLELLKVHERTASATVLVTHSIVESVLLSDRIVVMSTRPGTIAASVAVSLPRPRTLDMMASAEFQQIAMAVRGGLQSPDTGTGR